MATKKDDTITTDQTLPDIKSKEAEDAKKEGVLDAIRDDAADRFRATDGIAQADPEKRVITPTYDVFHLADLLELDPDALKDVLNGKGETVMQGTMSEGRAAGLLETERSGKNRDDIVKVLCDYLKIDSPYEVTDAGPGWTEVVNRKTVKPRS